MALKPAAKVIPIGVVLSVIGYVALKGTDGLEKLLKLGDLLRSDDHLKTGTDAELQIGFIDGSSLELGANAEAFLDTEVFDLSVLQGINSLEDALAAMRQAILAGEDPSTVLQAASADFDILSEGGATTASINIDTQSTTLQDSDATGALSDASNTTGSQQVPLGSDQPIGGDIETHSMPEMMLPKLSIASLSILEPEPGKEDEDHDEGDDSGHIPGGGHDGEDTGHDTTDEGHDTGSDSGHDTTDEGHDTGGHDSGGHDPGEGGGYSAGHAGGYGYAGGSLSSIAVFTVNLSAPSTRDVRVDFTTTDGTAISGGSGVSAEDFGQNSGTLIIPAGQTSGTIEITIFADKLVEGDEQFFVQLSNPVNAMIADGTAVGTIIDSGHGQGTEGEGQILMGTDGDDVLITKGGPDILDGGAGDDILISGGGPDVIHGGEGDDLIVGLGGPDELYGGPGNDEIVGHGGPDIIDGGEGDDIIYAGGAPDTVTGGPGDDFINAEGGPDIVDAGEGDDVIYGGGGPDLLQGGDGDDIIYGEGGPDTLDGGAGDDYLRGGGGPDLLLGGSGNDDLAGGGGSDLLIGGEGADILKGGGAGDIFRFENLSGDIDRIVDFDQQDQIDISAILDYQEGDPISNYVQISPSGTDPLSYELSVNAMGTGDPTDFQTVAVLENIQTALDLDQLVSNGNLVVIE